MRRRAIFTELPEKELPMIGGMHTIFYSKDAEVLRGFFRDVLKLRSVDAGHGWLIFAAPPTEIAVHPTQGNGYAEVFLMTANLDKTIAELRKRGIEFPESVTQQRWGRMARFKLPDGQNMGLYEPTHSMAIRMNATKRTGRKRQKVRRKKTVRRKSSVGRRRS
jgi:hypothetical protein